MRPALFVFLLLSACRTADPPASPETSAAEGPTYSELPGPETPLDELVRQAEDNPFFAELVGYALLDRNREPEAREWFERAYSYADSIRTVEGLGGDAAFAGYLVRTAWLARGTEAALNVVASVPPGLLRYNEAASPVCFVRYGKTEWLVDFLWHNKSVQEMGPPRRVVRISPTEFGEKPTPLDSCLTAI